MGNVPSSVTAFRHRISATQVFYLGVRVSDFRVFTLYRWDACARITAHHKRAGIPKEENDSVSSSLSLFPLKCEWIASDSQARRSGADK